MPNQYYQLAKTIESFYQNVNIVKHSSFEVFNIFKPYISKINNAFGKLTENQKKDFNQFMRDSFDHIVGTNYKGLEEKVFFGGYANAVYGEIFNEQERNFETWHAFFHEILSTAIHEKFLSRSSNKLQDHLNEDIVSYFQFHNFQKGDSFFAKAISEKLDLNLFDEDAKSMIELKDKDLAIQYIENNFIKIEREINQFPNNLKKIGLACFDHILKVFRHYKNQLDFTDYNGNIINSSRIINKLVEVIKNSLNNFLYNYLFNNLAEEDLIPKEIIHKFRMWILSLYSYISSIEK